MSHAKIIIQLEKPIDDDYIKKNKCNVIREDDLYVYLSEAATNSYKGDDESIVYDVSYRILKNYPSSYSIVWGESEY